MCDLGESAIRTRITTHAHMNEETYLSSPTAGATRVVLQSERRLSESAIWEMQRSYYDRAGAEAWQTGVVPTYATSNPFIARAYARVVAAFQRDHADAGPVTVIELGGGTGCFAFQFLRGWEAATGTGEAACLSYILTDSNPGLIAYWESHSALRPYLASGQLRLAIFDARDPQLSIDPPAGPLVVVANYFFDTIPQDAFYVVGGQIHESLAELVSTKSPKDTSDLPDFEDLTLSYRRVPAQEPLYREPEIDELLRESCADVSTGAVTWPITGLRTVESLRKLSPQAMLLLTSDKGYHSEKQLAGRQEPGFETHGSFSMSVNYDAIGRYFRRHGGRSLHLAHQHTHLDTCGFLLGPSPETEREFHHALALFSPEDYFMVQSALEDDDAPLTLQQILAYLRLGSWDTRIFEACFGRLLELLPEIPAFWHPELLHALDNVWHGYFHLGLPHDLPYDLGVLAYKLHAHNDAIRYFDASLALYGREAKTLYNLALCYYCENRKPEALHLACEAVTLDSSFTAAHALLRTLGGQKVVVSNT
jgi:tetratricopeptide (TPR) repeat protein